MKKIYIEKVLEARKDDPYHFTSAGDYHEGKDVMDIVHEVIEYADAEVNDADELRDDVAERADSATPIYNADRAEWFGKNWQAYDDIEEELGKEGMGDSIMQSIAIAYCLTLEREVMQALEEVFKEAEVLEEEANA